MQLGYKAVCSENSSENNSLLCSTLTCRLYHILPQIYSMPSRITFHCEACHGLDDQHKCKDPKIGENSVLGLYTGLIIRGLSCCGTIDGCLVTLRRATQHRPHPQRSLAHTTTHSNCNTAVV